MLAGLLMSAFVKLNVITQIVFSCVYKKKKDKLTREHEASDEERIFVEHDCKENKAA